MFKDFKEKLKEEQERPTTFKEKIIISLVLFFIVFGIYIFLFSGNKENTQEVANKEPIKQYADMQVLCGNYYKNIVARTKGSKVHLFGNKKIFDSNEYTKLVLDATYVNQYNAEIKIQVGCYVDNSLLYDFDKSTDYFSYDKVVNFEIYE